MRARLRRPEDEEAVVDLARIQTAETHPHLRFDEARSRATFRRAIVLADPIIFVVEDDDGAVIGVLQALLCPYAWHAGFFVSQEVLSVRPDRRGTRAAAMLIQIFSEWAASMDAEEVFTGVTNGRKIIKYAKFMDRLFGFKPCGIVMRRLKGQ